MKNTIVFIAISIFLNAMAWGHNDHVLVTRINELPVDARRLISPVLNDLDKILMNSSVKWRYGGDDHFLIAAEYSDGGACTFSDVNMTSQVVTNLDFYQLCKIHGPIKLFDLNQDGHIDFFVPVRRFIMVPTSMWINFTIAFIFNKETAQYCSSYDAGEVMDEFTKTKKKPEPRKFNDLQCP